MATQKKRGGSFLVHQIALHFVITVKDACSFKGAFKGASAILNI